MKRMKNKALASLLLLSLLAVLLPSPARAQGYRPVAVIEVSENSQKYKIDGFVEEFPQGCAPFYSSGVLFLPIRGMFEALGIRVEWDARKRAVSLLYEESPIEILTGTEKAYINKLQVFLEEGSFVILKGRSYMPLGFFLKVTSGKSQKSASSVAITLNKPLIMVTDATGRKVLVPARTMRIVSLYPMLTELLFLVKSEKYLTGSAKGPVINYDNFSKVFAAIASIPDASSFKDPNVETIISLKPDVVLAPSGTPLKKLEEAEIPTVILDLESPQKLMKSIQFLGNILHKEAQAYSVLSYMNQKLNYIAEKTKSVTRKKTVYIAGATFLSTFGGDFYQTYLLELAGAVNVAKDLKGGKVNISYEQLIKWNPDFIILTSYCTDSIQGVKNSIALKDLNAVKLGNVYRMPSFILAYDLPAPESILGIVWLSNRIYPGIVDFDFRKEAVDFYKKLFGYSLTQQDVAIIEDTK